MKRVIVIGKNIHVPEGVSNKMYMDSPDGNLMTTDISDEEYSTISAVIMRLYETT